MIGYWADFINPFSGQPHLNLQKSGALYKTDERFRCLGFKILHRNNCKVIVNENNNKNFIGKCANLWFIRKISLRIDAAVVFCNAATTPRSIRYRKSLHYSASEYRVFKRDSARLRACKC